MKLGILGTGMIVQDFLQTVETLPLESVYLLATERSREKAEKLAADYHLNGVSYDYKALLGSEIDTVYVALPNHLHYRFAKQALEQGKHVIIEKPITANAVELEKLMALADARGLMIFEAMSLHYMPSFEALRQDLALLGQIKVVSFNYSQYSSRYDAFLAGNILPVFDWHQAGGALMDLNVYNLHAMLGLFGAPRAVHYHANVMRGIDTSGLLFLDYADFKAVNIGAKDCKAPLTSTIQGDKAAVVIESPLSRMTEYRILYNDGREETRRFEATRHRMAYEFCEFIRMVEQKDFAAQRQALGTSLQAAKLMQDARRDAGIVFDNDSENG